MTDPTPPLWLFHAPVQPLPPLTRWDRLCFALSRFCGGSFLGRRDLRGLGPVPYGTDLGIRFRKGDRVLVNWKAPE